MSEFKVLFEKAAGAVKGYSKVKWTITHEHAAHKYDIGILESPAMTENDIADNNTFYKDNGYVIERVHSPLQAINYENDVQKIVRGEEVNIKV